MEPNVYLPPARRVERRGPGGGDAKSRFIAEWDRNPANRELGAPQRPKIEFEAVAPPEGGGQWWRAIHEGRYFERQRKVDAEMCWYELFMDPGKFEGSNEPAPWPPAKGAAPTGPAPHVQAGIPAITALLNLPPVPTVKSVAAVRTSPIGEAMRRIELLEMKAAIASATIHELRDENKVLNAELEVVRDTCTTLYERINSIQRRLIGLTSDIDVHGGWLHVLRDDVSKHLGNLGHVRSSHLPRCLPAERHSHDPRLTLEAYVPPQPALSKDGDVEENPGPEQPQTAAGKHADKECCLENQPLDWVLINRNPEVHWPPLDGVRDTPGPPLVGIEPNPGPREITWWLISAWYNITYGNQTPRRAAAMPFPPDGELIDSDHEDEPLIGVEPNPGPLTFWFVFKAAACSLFMCCGHEVIMDAEGWVRDLTREGVEPNPGWAHGKFGHSRKGKEKATSETPPTARSRENSPPGSPKDSLFPMREKTTRKPKQGRKTGTRTAVRGGAIKTSVVAAVQQLRGEQDALREMYRAGIPCRDYIQGRCTYGASCAYNHDVGASSSASGSAPKAVCRRFSRPQGCPFGAQCRFLHVGTAAPAAPAAAHPSAIPSANPATTVATVAMPSNGPTSLGSLKFASAQKARHSSLPVRLQAGGALSGTSASSTPAALPANVQPAGPSPAPSAATAAIVQVAPPPAPPLSDEMKERLKRERLIRRRLNKRTKLVFYERVGVSNPLTALILAAISLVLIAGSAITETALAFFEVEYWAISLLFTIPLVITCAALLMVCLVYVMAGQKLIRHQYTLIKDPSRWLPDEDLRSDLGATSRLDHDSQRLARFEYTRSFCFTHNEKSNRKTFLRYRCALAWENIVRTICFLPRLEIVSKKGEYSEELLAQCCNAHNMSVRTDLETVKDRVSQVVRTKASMPLNRFDQTSANYITGNTEALGVAVWMDQQRALRHLPFVVPPSPTATFSQ